MRGRGRTTSSIALLVAVASGAVLAAVAGGRRTDSAMRFLAFNRPPTVEVVGDVNFDAVRRLTQVASGDQGAFLLVVPPLTSGTGPWV